MNSILTEGIFDPWKIPKESPKPTIKFPEIITKSEASKMYNLLSDQEVANIKKEMTKCLPILKKALDKEAKYWKVPNNIKQKIKFGTNFVEEFFDDGGYYILVYGMYMPRDLDPDDKYYTSELFGEFARTANELIEKANLKYNIWYNDGHFTDGSETYSGSDDNGYWWGGCLLFSKKLKSLNKESANTIIPDINNSYIHASIYEEYLDNLISNEVSLAEHLSNCFNKASVVMEAEGDGATKSPTTTNTTSPTTADGNGTGEKMKEVSDKIKKAGKEAWTKFTEFINNIIDNFIDDFNKIVIGKSKWLQDNKDIIMKNKIRRNATYSGDYNEAIERCNNMQVPVFNYDKYSANLLKDGEQAIVEQIMSGKDGFQYKDGVKLEDMFKAYFLATDKTNNEAKEHGPDELESIKNTMYDTCINYSKLIGIARKDKEFLRQSTNAVQSVINDSIQRRNASQANTNNTQTVQNNSVYEDILHGRYVTEEGENTNGTNNQPPEDKPNTGTKLKIGSSYSDTDKGSSAENNAGGGKENSTANDIDKMVNKWIKVCRIIITAKLTAIRKIAEDYMAILQAHVQDYSGDNADPTT